jgi:hypothetical protein
VADGWELADFVRVLIVLGLSFRLVRLTSNEVFSHAKLSWAMGALDGLLTDRTRRPYSPRRDRGVWVPLHTPKELLRTFDMQVEVSRRSRNDILATALKEGLIIYLLAKTKLYQAIVRVREEKKLNPARTNPASTSIA